MRLYENAPPVPVAGLNFLQSTSHLKIRRERVVARIETGRKGKVAAPLPEIPDKLYFRIGEVARLLALPSYVLRFWETEFPHLKPAKGGTGQRLYRRREVDALIEIRRLLYDEGYTIPGARQFLKDKAPLAKPGHMQEQNPPDAPTDRGKLHQLRAELIEISKLLARPTAEPQVGNPAHRGLHLAARKRARRDLQPALFHTPADPAGDEEDGS